MIARFALLSIMTIGPVAMAQTPALCPWLTTALGGDVAVTAHSENNWQGSCHFTRQTSGSTQAIDIQVSKVNSHPCPGGNTKLKAMGNEAVECLRSTSAGEHADTIAGRVRDAWFEVTMTGVTETTREPPANTRPRGEMGNSMPVSSQLPCPQLTVQACQANSE
jgi:hypothetical protein